MEEAAKGLGILFVFSSSFRRWLSQGETADGSRTWELPGSFLLDLLGKESTGEREVDSPLDGLIYGALVGFGFELTENISYYGDFVSGSGSLFQFIFLRSVLLGFGHALFSGTFGLGIGIGRTREGPDRLLFPLAGYGLAVLMHGFYNYFAFQNVLGLLVFYFCLLVGMGTTMMILIHEERAWIQEELEDEIARGMLSQAEVNLVVDFSYRLLVDLNLLGKDRSEWLKKYRFLQSCAELALKKRLLLAGQTKEVGYQELEDLRRQVYHLRVHVEDDLTPDGD